MVRVRGRATRKRVNRKAGSVQQDREALQLGLYLSWLRNELDSEAACLEMPWTMLLLLTFAVIVYMHTRPDFVVVVEGAWKSAIEEGATFAWSGNFGHKNVYDVNSLADFWSWLRLGFLPLLVQHSWAWSEGLDEAYRSANLSGNFSSSLPDRLDLAYGLFADEPWDSARLPVRDDFLSYQKIVAGIRMQQERAVGSWEACHIPSSMPEDLWKDWLGKPCMLADQSYFLTPEVHQSETFNGEPMRVEWFLTMKQALQELQMMTLDMEDGCSDLASKATQPGRPEVPDECWCQSCQDGAQGPAGSLAPGPWLDEYTRRVEVSTVAYNQNFGLVSLVSVNFFINKAGHVHKLLDVQSARIDPYVGYLLSVFIMVSCDILWLIGLLKLLLNEVQDIVNTITGSQQTWWKALLFEYLAFWNIVDWLSLACAWAVLGTYIRAGMEVAATSSQLENVLQPDVQNQTREELSARSDLVFQATESLVSAEADFRITLLFFPMLVMLRLFKSFHAQPRLAIVTKTIITASQDLLHFFIVLLSVYTCMAVFGYLLFGQDVENFSTWDRVCITCFRALLGEWDWEEMETVGRVLAAIWLWCFVVLVVLLLLNMVLAILMDAYQVVKSKASVMVTVPQQISEMLRRRRLNREKKTVRLVEIWFAYLEQFQSHREMFESEVLVRPEDLVKVVPGLPLSQARRTLSSAQRVWRETNDVHYGMENMRMQLKMCNGRVKILQEEVSAIRVAVEEARDASGTLPSPTHLGLKESTLRIVDVLKDTVGGLRSQVHGVLEEECNIYELGHRQLQDDQRTMRVCAQDAKAKLRAMLERLEGLSATLEEHATKEQVHSVFGSAVATRDPQPSLLAGLHRSLAMCSEPTRGQSLLDEVQPRLCGPPLQCIRADVFLVQAVVFETLLLFTAPQALAQCAFWHVLSISKAEAVTARKKYREPGPVDSGLYRSVKETCISWDKRVHRGNTYSMYTQNAIKEAIEAAQQSQVSPKVAKKRRPKEKSIFDMPLPEHERVPVDLTKHLIASEEPLQVEVVECQTDEFLPEPPPEQYQPQRTGIDASTQVEDGELFDFDAEVEPILDVLVMKTLEQSVMEVEEEHELSAMTSFKGAWYERQKSMMAAWQEQVEEEWVRWHQKEAVMAAQRAQKEREARVLLKIQAVNAAKGHLANLVPNAVEDLKEVAFPDSRGLAIQRNFMQGLFQQVQQEVSAIKRAQQEVDEIVAHGVAAQQAQWSASLQGQREKFAGMEKLRLEELQIRRGKIRILIDDGSGNPVPVGPIQLSSADPVEELQARVYVWLQQNEPKIAAAWPHGVVLRLSGEPVQQTKQLFEAKPGQISMGPQEPPPPPEAEADEAAEGEEEEHVEAGRECPEVTSSVTKGVLRPDASARHRLQVKKVQNLFQRCFDVSCFVQCSRISQQSEAESLPGASAPWVEEVWPLSCQDIKEAWVRAFMDMSLMVAGAGGWDFA
ncbi:Polycystin-2 [Symbiodinium microadriaticum]|uniref:Polycystin-2 n=1 Tax=Symbiodinium microadriaticum TaxID=2951 RepID=A0A1Q9DKM7_SYMMI|nr:Polycystin-2 [Symbiodinium microadriaticum]